MPNPEKLIDDKEFLKKIENRWVSKCLIPNSKSGEDAEEILANIYAEEGVPPPKNIFWFPNPLQGAIAAQIVGSLDPERNLIWKNNSDGVWNSVNKNIKNQVIPHVEKMVSFLASLVNIRVEFRFTPTQSQNVIRESVRVLDQICESNLYPPHWEQIQTLMRDSQMSWSQTIAARERLMGQEILKRYVGQYDGGLSYYETFKQLGFKECSRMDAFFDLVDITGFCWFFNDVAILTKRHSDIHLDNEGRLHCESGQAISWPDGWGLSFWHGTEIPNDWLKGCLTPEIAFQEENIEKRRAAVEILGWEEILNHLGSKIIDEDKNPEVGTLLEVDLPDAPGSRFLRVRCGTGREFILPVPMEMMSALEANAWTYDLSPEEFKLLEVRT